MDEELQLTVDELLNASVLRMYGATLYHRTSDFAHVNFKDSHSATSYVSSAGWAAKARFRELPANLDAPVVIIIELR
jgi:hypothetical protein